MVAKHFISDKKNMTASDAVSVKIEQNDSSGAVVIDNVWKAAAYGDTDKLKELLETDGSQVNAADPSGYVPLQWAALNNRVATITQLLQFGAEVNQTEPGGQTALHWAATRGAIPAVELLLRSGADLTKSDIRGYTVCHVAAQYGQTQLLHHLALRWDADMDARDNDGRTCLHWAAYKGYGDPIRLLLCLGTETQLPDREGCTPLHWAAIKGNSEACTLLVQGGGAEALSTTDTTGSTPSQLAAQKGHVAAANWLANERSLRERQSKKGFCAEPPRGLRHLAPVLWAVVLGLLGMFFKYVESTTLTNTVPATSSISAWIVASTALGGLCFLLRAGTADPGFIRCGSQGSRTKTDGLQESSTSWLDNPLLWDGSWHMLCIQCKRVRPPRSKYCKVSKRCVARFDHYCPWIGNAVGEKNHRDFVIFLMLETIAMSVSLCAAVYRVITAGASTARLLHTHPGTFAFLIFDGVVLFSVLMLTCSQLGQVFQNMTTNEMMNQHRYKYLQDSNGTFRNPFDMGCWPNTLEFFLGNDCANSASVHRYEGIEQAPMSQKVEDRGLHSRHCSKGGHSGHGHSHGGCLCCQGHQRCEHKHHAPKTGENAV